LYYGLRVWGKNTILLYVTACEKVVPRLNKRDDVIELNFRKNAPPRNEELVVTLRIINIYSSRGCAEKPIFKVGSQNKNVSEALA